MLGVLLFLGPGADGSKVFAESPDEAPELRERLTERENENRVENPYEIQVFHRPLSLLGQYEIALDVLEQMGLGETAPAPSRSLLEQEVEGEAFYLLHENVSFFMQLRVLYEEDLESETPGSVSDLYLERGEMWFLAENLADSGLSLEAGRVEFEDDRTWWWDEELDAVRLTWELTGEDRALGQGFDVILAVEEWQRVELEFSAAAFRADRAFGSENDEWLLGGYAAFRYAF